MPLSGRKVSRLLTCRYVSAFFFFSSRRRHTRYWRDWSSDVCSSDLSVPTEEAISAAATSPATSAFAEALKGDMKALVTSAATEELAETLATAVGASA